MTIMCFGTIKTAQYGPGLYGLPTHRYETWQIKRSAATGLSVNRKELFKVSLPSGSARADLIIMVFITTTFYWRILVP